MNGTWASRSRCTQCALHMAAFCHSSEVGAASEW
eukprot:COSAG02_NODE_6301_length_3669_cov_1.892157_1_plen_33_part_10